MVTFLAVIHIVACFGLIVLVLIQDSKGGGVFTAQTGSNSVLGATGATTFAQTMTKVIAGVFAITCIGLSIMSARSGQSVVDGIMPTTETSAPAASAPSEVEAPPTAPATTE